MFHGSPWFVAIYWMQRPPRAVTPSPEQHGDLAQGSKIDRYNPEKQTAHTQEEHGLLRVTYTQKNEKYQMRWAHYCLCRRVTTPTMQINTTTDDNVLTGICRRGRHSLEWRWSRCSETQESKQSRREAGSGRLRRNSLPGHIRVEGVGCITGWDRVRTTVIPHGMMGENSVTSHVTVSPRHSRFNHAPA